MSRGSGQGHWKRARRCESSSAGRKGERFFILSFTVQSKKRDVLSSDFNFIFSGIDAHRPRDIFPFLIFSFYTVYYLRNELYGDYIYFVMVILICIFTDIGGYVFGKIFKGPKLTKISPNKTYAGAIGSLVLSLILGYLFFINQINFTKTNFNVFVFIIIVSVLSQIGDLIISILKRKAKIKDTGTFLPGHGGILDRIDGMLLAIPLGVIFISLYYD